jgi:hypothetical protein
MAWLKASQKLKSGTYSNQVRPSHFVGKAGCCDHKSTTAATPSQLKPMVKPQLVAMDAVPTPPSVFTKQSPVDVDNPNTQQTPEYTKDKYNVKIIK